MKNIRKLVNFWYKLLWLTMIKSADISEKPDFTLWLSVSHVADAM